MWIWFSLTVLIIWITYATVMTVSTWDTLTADMWNSMAWNYDYSLSEVNTGKKWVDLKPIYRKVVTLASTSINDFTRRTINYDNPPIDVDIIVWKSFKGNDFQTYEIDSTWSKNFSLWISSMSYKLWTNTSYDNLFVAWNYIILEYTKTTD